MTSAASSGSSVSASCSSFSSSTSRCGKESKRQARFVLHNLSESYTTAFLNYRVVWVHGENYVLTVLFSGVFLPVNRLFWAALTLRYMVLPVQYYDVTLAVSLG